MGEEFQISDIYNWEMKLKATIYELQRKNSILEKVNIDFDKSRQVLYEERLLLNKERRRVKELELQFKSSQEMVEFLEKDKIKYQQEKIQLQVNCDIATKERDSLLNQTRNGKMENIKLLSKIHQLEEEIFKQETFNKTVRSFFGQLKDEMIKLTENFQRNVSKLEQEQENLRHSVKNTSIFNQRLVMMLKCKNVKLQKQSETILELQTRFNENLMKEEKKSDEISNINSAKKQVILDDEKSDSDEDLDKQVEIDDLQMDRQDNILMSEINKIDVGGKIKFDITRKP